MRVRCQRALLKLSGEALMGQQGFGIDPEVIEVITQEILNVHASGVKLGLVVGGGNIFRGLRGQEFGIGRVAADHMGMLATLMNAIALSEALRNKGAETRVVSAMEMGPMAEPYERDRVLGHLNSNRIVLFATGTGNPYFTTDTAATLRALEMGADALLKATRVDGVYDEDPEKNPSAKYFKELTYREVIERGLKVMDLTAISLAMEHRLPIVVFNLKKRGNMEKAVRGEEVGTIIGGDAQ